MRRATAAWLALLLPPAAADGGCLHIPVDQINHLEAPSPSSHFQHLRLRAVYRNSCREGGKFDGGKFDGGKFDGGEYTGDNEDDEGSPPSQGAEGAGSHEPQKIAKHHDDVTIIAGHLSGGSTVGPPSGRPPSKKLPSKRPPPINAAFHQHAVNGRVLNAASTANARRIAKQACVSLVAGNGCSDTASVTEHCGGEWLPSAGRLGDLAEDSIMTTNLAANLAAASSTSPPAQYGSSIVFRLTPSSVRQITMMLNQGQSVSVCFGQATAAAKVTSKSPSSLIKVGSVELIRATPNLIGSAKTNITVSLRTFINPGWWLNYRMYGNEVRGLLSLKGSNCDGFYDTLAYRFFTPLGDDNESTLRSYSYNPAVVPVWSSDVSSSASADFTDFALAVDGKRESAPLARWQMLVYGHQRLVPRSTGSLWSHEYSKESRVATPSAAATHPSSTAFPDAAATAPRNLSTQAAGVPKVVVSKLMLLSSSPPRGAESVARMQLCYYPAPNAYGGRSLGTVTFVPSKPDSVELIGLIIYCVIALPFAAGITLSCYTNKHRRTRREWCRRKLVLKREEIEKRLMRRLGVDGDSPPPPEEDDESSGNEEDSNRVVRT